MIDNDFQPCERRALVVGDVELVSVKSDVGFQDIALAAEADEEGNSSDEDRADDEQNESHPSLPRRLDQCELFERFLIHGTQVD